MPAGEVVVQQFRLLDVTDEANGFDPETDFGAAINVRTLILLLTKFSKCEPITLSGNWETTTELYKNPGMDFGVDGWCQYCFDDGDYYSTCSCEYCRDGYGQIHPCHCTHNCGNFTRVGVSSFYFREYRHAQHRLSGVSIERDPDADSFIHYQHDEVAGQGSDYRYEYQNFNGYGKYCATTANSDELRDVFIQVSPFYRASTGSAVDVNATGAYANNIIYADSADWKTVTKVYLQFYYLPAFINFQWDGGCAEYLCGGNDWYDEANAVVCSHSGRYYGDYYTYCHSHSCGVCGRNYLTTSINGTTHTWHTSDEDYEQCVARHYLIIGSSYETGTANFTIT